jgi:hypothetical protein
MNAQEYINNPAVDIPKHARTGNVVVLNAKGTSPQDHFNTGFPPGQTRERKQRVDPRQERKEARKTR